MVIKVFFDDDEIDENGNIIVSSPFFNKDDRLKSKIADNQKAMNEPFYKSNKFHLFDVYASEFLNKGREVILKFGAVSD